MSGSIRGASQGHIITELVRVQQGWGAGGGPTGLKTRRGIGISLFTLGWKQGMLTGYSANLVSAGSHAETEREDGGDGSGSRGPGGELDSRWWKLNSRVGRRRGVAKGRCVYEGVFSPADGERGRKEEAGWSRSSLSK